MTDSYFQDFTPYIFCVLGIVLLFTALFKKPKPKQFHGNAETVEGIIFKLGVRNNSQGSSDVNSINDKVTVRFLTKKNEWITADINNDYAIFYSGQYKEGDKIKVIYDPKNPKDYC